MANTYLSRTQGTATLGRKYTFSCWIKRSKITDRQQFIRTTGYGYFEFQADDKLHYYDVATGGDLVTNKVFRDTNAWYHIVLSVDTTLATADDRHKIYINGVQETSFADRTNPTQNNGGYFFDDGRVMYIGSNEGSNLFFNGCISHLHGIDGTAYDASAFGSFDNDTGEWSINTSPSVSYGTNGGFWLKDGSQLTDSSSNSNTLTVGGGTLTKTEDCPSNVFATLNPLNIPTSNTPTFSNGNNTSITSTSGSGKWGGSTTLGMTSGKFYCEAKATIDASYSRSVIGITGNSANLARTNESIFNATDSWGYYSSDGSVQGNGSGNISGFTTSYTTGDVIMIALDLDNNKLYFGKNGTWINSGVPTSGNTGTGAISIVDVNTTNDGAYFFAQTDDTGTSAVSKFDFNFGNGYFGSTQISSAGTNASGIGIFEHDCPNGYTALSTKGLNL